MQSKMIPLTIANTLNQAAKQRVDVKQDQTVRQAVVASGLGLNGQFDVFNEHGEVISNNHVSDFQDRTVYVGAQRIAGGAWDDDDDDWAGLDDLINPQPARKVVRVSYAGRVRELEPNGNETLQQLVERQGMNPMDGSAMAVYDEDEVVSGQRASNFVGRTVRYSIQRVMGGSGRGLSLEYLPDLQIEFPSLMPVKEFVKNGHCSLFSFSLPMVGSSERWRLLLYAPQPMNGQPHVLVLPGANGRVPSGSFIHSIGTAAGAYGLTPGTLPSSIEQRAKWLCHGNCLQAIDGHARRDSVGRLGAFLNHANNLLNGNN